VGSHRFDHPCTNSTETIINNSIGMIAAATRLSSIRTRSLRKLASLHQYAHQAIMAAGGPANLLTTIEVPTIQTAQELMTHPTINLLAVTVVLEWWLHDEERQEGDRRRSGQSTCPYR